MRSKIKERIIKGLVLLMTVASFFGCARSGKTVSVGSKEYTEQLLLGQITILALEDAGYHVNDKTGVAGSNKVRSALLNKDIDVYWEYTGTGWISHLQHDTPLTDSKTCYEQVKAEDAKNGIDWLDYAPFNNTYTVMMRKSQADELNIKTLSDLGRYITSNPDALTFAVDHEFTARSDGLPGLENAYGFKLRENKIIVMDNAIIYKALKEQKVDIGMGFSTDGRIKAFDLLNIQDDKSFFPVYNPAPNLRIEFAQKNPEVVSILNKISAKLDTETIMKMNYEVDIEQKVPRDVAKAWMKEVGLIK